MNLRDVKVIFMCPDHNNKYKARKKSTETLLNKIGFTNIIHYTTGHDTYPSSLLTATNDILKTNLDEPFLLIEDDCGFTGIDEFEFVPEADAIYFGLSKSAGHSTENVDKGESIFVPYSQNYVRVMNMLSAHAILYISRSYKEAVINILTENKTYYNDVLMARLQPLYLILALKQPIFFQAAIFNDTTHEENWTNIIIKDDLTKHPGPGHFYLIEIKALIPKQGRRD